MSTNKLIRLSGIAAMLCGLATAVFWFVHPSAADPRALHDATFFAAVQSQSFVGVFLLFVALILASLLALVGYYVRLVATSGIAGLIAFLLAFVGTAMFLASGVFQCAVAPVLAHSPATRPLLEPDGALLGGLLGLLFAGTGCTFALREGAEILSMTEPTFRHRLQAARQQMEKTFDGLCALVNKQGACYQCNVLRDAAPRPRRGEPVRPIGKASQTAAERLQVRLQIVQDAQLDTGNSRLLHEVIFRLMSRMFDGQGARTGPPSSTDLPIPEGQDAAIEVR